MSVLCADEIRAFDMDLRAFLQMGKGEWTQARDELQQVIQDNADNLTAVNNLAVCEVYLGNLGRASPLRHSTQPMAFG